MSFWFVIWVVISAFLLGFLAWTIFILHKQKSAWKSYAAKHKLRYKPNALFDAPDMNGIIDTHAVNLFASEHDTTDARYTRKTTTIEIQLASKMPIEGGLASSGLVDIVQNMGFKEELRPDHKLWEKSYIASADDKAVLEAYLTKERLDVLLSLMKVENFWVIFVFKAGIVLLRLDTSDPLGTEKKLDQIVGKMIEAAQILELKKGEGRRLKQELAKRPVKSVSLDVGEGIEDTGLQLEEDDDAEAEVEAEVTENQDSSEEPAPAEKASSSKKKSPSKKKPSTKKS